MSLGPWISVQRGADGVLRLGFDRERDAVFIGERAAEDDEARGYELVHEGRMGRPTGLFLEREQRVPLRT